MTCLPCSDITSDENAQDFLTHGNCSCDSSSQICNDDNACGDGAIVNNENKCQCLFDHILATDWNNYFCHSCQSIRQDDSNDELRNKNSCS